MIDSISDASRSRTPHRAENTDRLVMVLLIVAAIASQKWLSFTHVLLLFLPTSLAYGLTAGYLRRRKMRT
jgi:hypothetical protein